MYVYMYMYILAAVDHARGGSYWRKLYPSRAGAAESAPTYSRAPRSTIQALEKPKKGVVTGAKGGSYWRKRG